MGLGGMGRVGTTRDGDSKKREGWEEMGLRLLV